MVSYNRLRTILLILLFAQVIPSRSIRGEFNFTKAALISSACAIAGIAFAAYTQSKKVISSSDVAEIKDFDKERDLKAVSDLLAANSLVIEDSKPEDAVSGFNKDLKRGLAVKVMYEKEQLVGFVTYLKEPDEDKLGYIGVLCVDERYRSKGYGKRLFCLVRDQMWQVGAEKIEWQVSKNNMRAVQFYKKLGALIIVPWFKTPFYVGWYFRSTFAELFFKANILLMRMKLCLS